MNYISVYQALTTFGLSNISIFQKKMSLNGKVRKTKGKEPGAAGWKLNFSYNSVYLAL